MTDKEKLDAIRAEIHRLVDVRGYDNFEQELYKAFGQVKDFTLGMQIAKWFYDMGKNSQEPVSEELDEAASSFARKDSEGISNSANFYYTVADKARIFKSGAKWQIARLMKDAIDVTVHIDAGGYPYIPQIELYDYDKDVPLAKEGDKYKVILIKEE